MLGKLGGKYWNTGTMHPNRFDSWPPGRRTTAPSLKSPTAAGTTNAFAYYAIDGGKATKIDLLALVAPASRRKPGCARNAKIGLPGAGGSPATLDARGRLRFNAMLYVPRARGEP